MRFLKAVRESGGASLLEMTVAIAIATLAMPLAYRQISNLSVELKVMSAAKNIASGAEPVLNFLRLYSGEFVPGEMAEVEIEGENTALFVANLSGEIVAFLVDQNYRNDVLKAHKIAGMLGAAAAVVEDDGMAYSPNGNWAAAIPGAVAGDIAYRIKAARTADDTAKYLHRTVLSEGELSTMRRDLSMGGFSIGGANLVFAKKLSSTDLDAYLVNAGSIAAGALYFAGGLNLNPERAKIPNMRVSGDVIGFRNLYADDFQSPSGALTTDRAEISGRLVVSKKFEVKSPYSRSISGFNGLSAASVRTAYLDADTLTFAPGFGLVVSGELLYGSSAPIKIGAWSFPNSNGAGPRMSSLRLSNFGGKKIDPDIPDFSNILKEGWR